MSRRIFMVMALAAMINLAALAAIGGVAWGRGYLTRDRVLAAAAALRGELSTSQPAIAIATSAPAPILPSAEQIARNDAAEELRRAALDQREREIQHQWDALEAREVAMLREKDDFEAAQKRIADEAEARAKAAGESGWAKQVELISSLKPKTAKDLLRGKSEPEVVRIFMELDARKTQKVIEQCKTAEERQWIGRILDQLHQRSATQAEALSAGMKPAPGA